MSDREVSPIQNWKSMNAGKRRLVFTFLILVVYVATAWTSDEVIGQYYSRDSKRAIRNSHSHFRFHRQ